MGRAAEPRWSEPGHLLNVAIQCILQWIYLLKMVISQRYVSLLVGVAWTRFSIFHQASKLPKEILQFPIGLEAESVLVCICPGTHLPQNLYQKSPKHAFCFGGGTKTNGGHGVPYFQPPNFSFSGWVFSPETSSHLRMAHHSKKERCRAPKGTVRAVGFLNSDDQRTGKLSLW